MIHHYSSGERHHTDIGVMRCELAELRYENQAFWVQ